MDQMTIKLVRHSWQKVERIAPQASAIFYENVFTADPSLKSLFKQGDMTAQGQKLMQMIGVAISKLDELDVLVPVLENLAKRHVGYGVQQAHYQIIGDALIQALDQGLGADFTPDVKNAWVTVYGVMADVMISASKY
ncbi:MAG: globin family protein [Halothiobacillus sp.]